MSESTQGETLYLLEDDREIGSRRLWAWRAVMVLGIVGSIPQLALLDRPAYSAGMLVGFAVIYWVGLQILSQEAD